MAWKHNLVLNKSCFILILGNNFGTIFGEYISIPRQHPINVRWTRPIISSIPINPLEILQLLFGHIPFSYRTNPYQIHIHLFAIMTHHKHIDLCLISTV